MKEKNILLDRPNIREFVKEMRAIHGNQFPAEEIIKSITGNTVITGLRNIAEVETFRKQFKKDFIMIAVDASLEVRYARIHNRGRHGDDIPFETFKVEEDKERREESGSHEMDKVIETADFLVDNNGTKDQLFEELRQIQVHTP